MIWWSLFDGSGIACYEAAKAGHKVVCFNYDDADHGDYSKYDAKMRHPNITYVNAFIDDKWLQDAADGKYGEPDIILAFPPCTDLAVSGAPAFPRKFERDPDFQKKAVATCKIAAQIADFFEVPYMIENPVSVLATMWRPSNYTVQPWEYGGYLPEDDVHPFFPDFINARDSYPKKTCLWTGNGFRLPGKIPVYVEPGYSEQYKRLGGKSKKTKVIRSLTPRGLARAIILANSLRFDK